MARRGIAIGMTQKYSGGTALHGQNCWHICGMAFTWTGPQASEEWWIGGGITLMQVNESAITRLEGADR
ncbi:MAG: hypothetical protein ACRET6_06770 [Burkholderiales bacterium]